MSTEPEVHSGEDFVHIEEHSRPPTGVISLSDSIVNVEKEDAVEDEEEYKDSDSVVSGGDAGDGGEGSSEATKAELPAELAKSVVILTCESTGESGSCDVYLIGTAHVSKESCREVKEIISFFKPEAVFVELCASRVSINLQPQSVKIPTMSDMIESWKQKHNTSGILYGWFLAKISDHMGTKISDHIFMTPNKLSEEMIKCASAIYSKLADPPSINHGFSSPSSSPSSASEFSPQEQYDMWSPSFRRNSSFDDQFEFSGPYSSMIEVSHVHRNHRRGRDLDLMNRNFRLMIKQLESVDPRNLTHQEKLAFWINIHNALVMHTFLANGIPQNNGKRFLLLSKPAYNIGGRMVSVEAIQSYILRIKMPRPGQWLKLLLIPRKFRTGDEHQEYSLDHSEPLLYFALCSGNHSDPAIRVYTPKGIYQELETAKEEYVRATFGVKKDQKLVLPKIIESFSKDSGLSQAALMEMIQECLPETMKKRVKKLNSGRSRKNIVEWMPHSFVFRYLIARELVK